MVLVSELTPQLRTIADRLFDLIDKFTQSRVLVIGDLTLDEFLTGQVERVSREAPVLILRHETTKQVPGGGANAVHNFARLGGQVLAVGLLGKDEQGKALRRLLETIGVNTEGVFLDPNRHLGRQQFWVI
ncbi:MAG: PfkB family carbohydrate kinase [Scytonema sp. PMC 1069.18]|nr:PfkB family carbohydrate kinase [Scytonema sp. PMC 1069.18]MEC4888038.1 PfkB family carbohydrate kinase [Scytonema sp. PMC 1070.18]